MAVKAKLALAFSLFILLALCINLALSREEEPEEEVDPELKTCIHQCRQQQQYSRSDKQACIRSCERYHQMKKERERQIEEETRRREKEEEEEEEEEEADNPYIFEDEDFKTKLETEDGRVRVLQKFTRRSKLLRGIENFRLATLEAKGHTFMSPCHFDSDTVIFSLRVYLNNYNQFNTLAHDHCCVGDIYITSDFYCVFGFIGRATIGVVKEDKTERFNLERGDIMRVPAGTLVYVVNKDENQKLFLAKFFIPVSTPGEFKVTFLILF